MNQNKKSLNTRFNPVIFPPLIYRAITFSFISSCNCHPPFLFSEIFLFLNSYPKPVYISPYSFQIPFIIFIYIYLNELRNRIVLFAPLYLSNYCVNGCEYCPYHMKNKNIKRKKLQPGPNLPMMTATAQKMSPEAMNPPSA